MRGLLPVEGHLEGRILADPESEVSPSAQLHVQPDRVTRGSDVGEHAWELVLLGAALLVDGAEVGGEGELERLDRIEQASLPGPSRVGRLPDQGYDARHGERAERRTAHTGHPA